MSFDIYGNNLAKGPCEVHPWVYEEYPCSVCDMEHQKHKQEKEQQREMEREYAEEMAKQERDYYALLEIAHEVGACLV